MSYNVRNEGGYAVVELTGDIDLSCSPEARKMILECLESAENTLVDLSAVSYIDSSGVASLVEGYQTAKKKALKFGGMIDWAPPVWTEVVLGIDLP